MRFLALSFILCLAIAQHVNSQILGIYKGQGQNYLNWNDALRHLGPGSVLIIGEEHASFVAQNLQLQVLSHLQEQVNSEGKFQKIHVGMEFISYPHQETLDLWLKSGNPYKEEKNFLSAIRWNQGILRTVLGDQVFLSKGYSFEYYRDQILFPSRSGGKTIALNAPQELVRRVREVGIDKLTEEERTLLPPDFQMGDSNYFKRFRENSGHAFPTPEIEKKYFQAQCVWDDTMAWKAQQWMARYPNDILVIIVGEFHVEFGGGLPKRLRYRLKAQNIQSEITTLVQVPLREDESLADVLQQDPIDGERAQIIVPYKYYRLPF